MTYPKEAVFCVKYLKRLGLLSDNHLKVLKALAEKSTTEFNMTEVADDSFFTELATQLRLLWPTGDKDGKYAWRESVTNLSSRLKTLWRVRELKDYSIETCLEVARRYLAQFEHNVKYMQTVKYFVLKQKKLELGDGRIKYINQSVFADMLENATVDEQQQSEWDALLAGNHVGEGVLI